MDGRVTMSNSKEELIDYAKSLGLEADDGMKKQEIYDTIEAYMVDEEPEAVGDDEDPETEGDDGRTDEGEGDHEPQGTDEKKEETEKSESDYKDRKAKALEFRSGHSKYAYVGATVKSTSLRENAVFSGSLEEVLEHLAPELEEFPEAVEMIIPVCDLVKFNNKKKNRGNSIYNKYKATESMAARKRKEQAKK